MGEIADDMIEGNSCSWCGVYFEKPHGYPVVCDHCRTEYEDYDPKQDPQPAKHKEL